MRYILAIFVLVWMGSHASHAGNGQGWIPKRSFVSIQYAGSIGFLSAGYARANSNEVFEIGAHYGYLPPSLGGTIHTLTIKASILPFHLVVTDKWSVQPLVLSSFLSQSFGKNLDFDWDEEKYPDDYYWWPMSTRWHIAIGTQVSHTIKNSVFEKISWYFEMNTNDLYLASIYGNTQALGVYDILFFGTGLKFHFSPRKSKNEPGNQQKTPE